MPNPAQQPATRSYIGRVVLRGLPKQMCGGLTEVTFTPHVNILAGPNGSGKSTILRVMRDRDWAQENECQSWREGEANLEWVAFDGEQDNPRFKPGRGPLQFISHVGSHGEVQKRVYAFLYERIEPGMLVMLDEPEAALDMAGISQLIAYIAQRGDVQWVIASHHPAIWKIPGARLIELRPGHVKQMIAVWQGLVGS